MSAKLRGQVAAHGREQVIAGQGWLLHEFVDEQQALAPVLVASLVRKARAISIVERPATRAVAEDQSQAIQS